MWCALYKFIVTDEKSFIAAWHEVTQMAIDEYESLGARLHKLPNGEFLAYAQWPNQETWQKGHHLIEEHMKSLHLGSCLAEAPDVLYEMTVVDDLLVTR